MDQVDAEARAYELMKRHGLLSDGWTVGRTSRWISSLGRTEYRARVIRLSLPNVLSDRHANVVQLLPHEIAHVLVGAFAGHGFGWLVTAREISYISGRLGSSPCGSEQQAALDAAFEAELKEIAELGSQQLSRPVARGLEGWFVARNDLHNGRVYAVRPLRCSVLTPLGVRFLPIRCLLEIDEEGSGRSTQSWREGTKQQL